MENSYHSHINHTVFILIYTFYKTSFDNLSITGHLYKNVYILK